MNLNKKNQKFLITGGTGFIGSKLVEQILKDGHSVTIFTRNKNHSVQSENLKYISDLEGEFNYDIIINLCGEPISQRWTTSKKTAIYKSRIDITKKLAENIKNSKTPPSLFISGSAIGYYGTSQNQIFDEETTPTSQNLFSQNLCKDWEEAANSIKEKTRLVILRTSVVIGKNSGIMKKMLLPFKLGLGGKIGNGRQNLSWIYIDDEIGIISHIINNENIFGAINLAAPNVTNNEIFSKTLAKTLNRPCIFDMPGFVAKIIFGQMAEELLLNGQNVFPKKILENGYKFQVTDLKEAILKSI